MENKIMMPASYNVLSCEEMTYTEGGATVGQAVAAWLWPGYATVIGINTCREARKKDHDNWVSNVWSDIKADCKGNVTNTFYHAGMIFWNAASTIGWVPDICGLRWSAPRFLPTPSFPVLSATCCFPCCAPVVPVRRRHFLYL